MYCYHENSVQGIDEETKPKSSICRSTRQRLEFFIYYHMKHNLVYWNMICYITFLFYFLVCLSFLLILYGQWMSLWIWAIIFSLLLTNSF